MLKSMKKHYFNEDNGFYYELAEDGMYYPMLKLPEKENLFVGRYGRMCERYLKQNHRIEYTKLLTTGKLAQHLHEVEMQAQEMMDVIVAKMANADGCDETSKVIDQMRWVGLMNNYKACAKEVVTKQLFRLNFLNQ